MSLFRVKEFVGITRAMLAHFRASQGRVTDLNVGSVARTMLEAPAAEIDELYQQMAQGLAEGIPTAIYRSFDFELKPALAASGLVRFSVDPTHEEPILIPAGTIVASRATRVQYRTAEAATVPVGQSAADVLVTATTAGTEGNAAVGLIDLIVSSGTRALGVANPRALVNGRGAETDAERKLRFVEFVRTLAHGTVPSVVFACRQAQIVDPATGTATERVARVTVEETAGHVHAYVHNGAGATSAALVARAQALVDGYEEPGTGVKVPGRRPTGMRVDVVAMTEIAVAASLVAQVPVPLRTVAVTNRIVSAVSAMIRATPSGGALRPLDLVNAMLTVTEVAGGEVEAPTLAVPCPVSAVLVPGAIAVAWR